MPNMSSLTINGVTYNVQDADAAPATESSTYLGCYYRTVDGATEWINPPMVIGTEYRTTERYNGQPVYIKAVDIGALANSDRTVTLYSATVVTPIDCWVRVTSGSITQMLPFVNSSGDLRTSLQITGNSVVIATFSDISAYSGVATVKYIKA